VTQAGSAPRAGGEKRGWEGSKNEVFRQNDEGTHSVADTAFRDHSSGLGVEVLSGTGWGTRLVDPAIQCDVDRPRLHYPHDTVDPGEAVWKLSECDRRCFLPCALEPTPHRGCDSAFCFRWTGQHLHGSTVLPGKRPESHATYYWAFDDWSRVADDLILTDGLCALVHAPQNSPEEPRAKRLTCCAVA
jgi:hypothetical protein